jgi:dihydrofolate reductase
MRKLIVSCRLVHSLLLAGLVDELRLMVFPVSIGAGLRVFPDDQVKLPWRRVDSVELPTGVRVDTYPPAG